MTDAPPQPSRAASPKASWWPALRRIALGTVLTLGGAEAGFRGLELVLDRSDDSPEGAAVTILAEGDSFTYGIGGLSFPQQLEEILNERAGERRYRAVNKGIPGLNSAVLAERFEDDLERYEPQVAVVLIGENNSWNSIRVDAPGSAWTSVDRALMHSRVYKFVRVAVIGWGHNTFHEAAAEADAQRRAQQVGDDEEKIGLVGEPHVETIVPPDVPEADLADFLSISGQIERGEYEAAIERLKAFVARFPEEAHGYDSLGGALKRLDRLDEAAATLEEGLRNARFTPTFEEIYHTLATTYTRMPGRLPDAERVWTEGLTKFPKSKALYWGWAKSWHDRGDTWGALSVEEKVPAIRDNELFAYQRKLLASTGHRAVDADVSEAFREDLRDLAAAASRHGTKLILSSYPDVAYAEVEDVARELGLDYVDFRPLFEARFQDRAEYISPDRCHCNTAGYRLMAEVFADHVERALGEEQAAR